MGLFTGQRRLVEDYQIIGFISSGTYGRVYKAQMVRPPKDVVAIKKCVTAFRSCMCFGKYCKYSTDCGLPSDNYNGNVGPLSSALLLRACIA